MADGIISRASLHYGPPTDMKTLALDIGGANLKLAHSNGSVRSEQFELWRQPDKLPSVLAKLAGRMPAHELVAVTMTAELCDCFETKSSGVRAILDSVERSLGRRKRTTIRVWLSDGRLVSIREARADPIKAAASNWLALASWAGRLCNRGPALVMDIGSTTCDIIPLSDGVPVPHGRNDFARLACGELVYTGVRRTPASAVLSSVNIGEHTCRLATEFFATTWDAYIWLRDLAEEPRNSHTADGRPATRANSAARLARVVCGDRTTMGDSEITEIARQISDAQRGLLVRAMSEVEMRCGRHATHVVTAGSGEFLARRMLERLHKPPAIISVAERHGPEVSAAACAYALAMVASETAA